MRSIQSNNGHNLGVLLKRNLSVKNIYDITVRMNNFFYRTIATGHQPVQRLKCKKCQYQTRKSGGHTG